MTIITIVLLLMIYNVATEAFVVNKMRKSRIDLEMANISVEAILSRCKEKICAALDIEDCIVRSDSSDPNGIHLQIEVVSPLFEGKRSMQRQQLVYKALWDELRDEGAIHAVDSIVTKTAEE
jgi:BolA-like protein 1